MHMFVDHMISHDACSLQVIQTLLTSGEVMEVSYNHILDYPKFIFMG